MRKAGIASEIARLERLRDSHFDDQLAIRRKIGYGEKSLAGATQRIAEIAQDLARRTPTRGEAFVMTVGDRKLTERKAAGEALIALAEKLKPKKPGVTAPVGAIGGFAIEARTTTFDELELKLGRARRSDPIACERDVTPLGLVSRLEAALSRFEVELAEERRTVAEVSGWLPGFKARLGDPFPHQAELDEKRAEMAELEASLAATPGDAAPPEAAGSRRLTVRRRIETPNSLLPLNPSRQETTDAASTLVRALTTPRSNPINSSRRNGTPPRTRQNSQTR